MNHFTKTAFAGLMVIGISSSVFASSYECDSGEQAEWKTKDEAKVVLEADGYEVHKVKIEDGCYELYTKKDGKKLEVFVNPATLKIVKIEED